MKYYIIAGEASGDMHGANLMKSIKKNDPQAEFRIWGGDLMHAQGGELVRHIRDTAFMGLAEVLKNYRKISQNINLCKKDMKEYQPDVLLLIDYGGFNLRMAQYAKTIGLRVYYYISPKFWAWRESRVERVKRHVDKMFLIFPFEIDFYKKHGYKADFVGNPLLDNIDAYKDSYSAPDVFRKEELLDEKPIIALLPGSRKQEIEAILPYQLSVAKHFPDYQFVIAAAPVFPQSFYQKYISDTNVKLVYDRTYEVMHHAEAALVTSGTATLETAIFNTPQVVCMRTNWLTYHIGKSLIKVDFLSLVNLIMEKEVIRELIQQELNEDLLVKELKKIVTGGSKRDKILESYAQMRVKLGGTGASDKTAQKIVEYLYADIKAIGK